MAARIAPERFLAGLPLFAELDALTLARIAAATTRRPLKRGETLFRKGDPPTGMYVLVYGEIRLIAHSARGPRLTGIVGPGRSFAEPVMFLERPAIVDAQAASDALVLHIPKAVVFAELERNPRFARRLIAGLSKRIESLVHELDLHAVGGGMERAVAYLMRGREEGGGPFKVELPASKAAVASQLHLTPEHFSRILHELEARGAIRISRRTIEVPDSARLETLLAPQGRPKRDEP